MNQVSILRQNDVSPLPGAALEQLLVEMAKHGKPRLSMVGDGWFCCVEMNTNTTGTSFEVKSDFSMPTPTAATTQCRDRIAAAMKAIGVSA